MRARRVDLTSGRTEGEPFDVLRLNDTLVPTPIAGTAPIVAPDQVIFVLGDFWAIYCCQMMEKLPQIRPRLRFARCSFQSP